MARYLVITAVGEDRPGLVNTLSEAILESGANIDESRMALLGGEFAMILLVSGDDVVIERLEQMLPSIGERTGLTLSGKETTPPAANEPTLPYEVTVVAMDQPGIVHFVTDFFSSRGINIRELSTTTYAAPHTGAPMFSMEMVVDIPAGSKLSSLRGEFVDYCDEQMIDAVIEPVSG